MSAVFWIIVVVGVALTFRAIVSPRRNPPMRKCAACNGDGVVTHTVIYDNFGAPMEIDAMTCLGCDGCGWVTR